MKIALTGGTGFVGSHVIEVALRAGHQVRALTRRDRPARDGVEWVEGRLEDQPSLDRLAERADAIVHVAGVINANAAGFDAGNVAGTANMIAAAENAGVRRFVHVSSLAAREPGISLYGASKARSEEVVRQSALDWSIVRPPAVYGPGDRETLDLFRMARTGFILLPPQGRLSLVHADDLSRLLIALAERQGSNGGIAEPDDGREGGWSHREFAGALGRAVGRKTIALSAPKALIRAGAQIDGLVRRGKAKLTADRAAYFCHPDWVSSPECRPDRALWEAEIDTERGLSETANWYRRHGWM